eukprot:CAMPEP_0198425104 /NCGR_PEP_ID=MMETSP1452-20131203/4328_1 /TAXON_ID=1181717 /ORGANISM="Synchroma pusillum, Strain CCMP3072" /LENGTH=365 /DNA_ID=CAMNT_0044145457 /DNA_START=106 /DNA_END=1200 /DNA_ORIENTATION=+
MEHNQRGSEYHQPTGAAATSRGGRRLHGRGSECGLGHKTRAGAEEAPPLGRWRAMPSAHPQLAPDAQHNLLAEDVRDLIRRRVDELAVAVVDGIPDAAHGAGALRVQRHANEDRLHVGERAVQALEHAAHVAVGVRAAVVHAVGEHHEHVVVHVRVRHARDLDVNAVAQEVEERALHDRVVQRRAALAVNAPQLLDQSSPRGVLVVADGGARVVEHEARDRVVGRERGQHFARARQHPAPALAGHGAAGIEHERHVVLEALHGQSLRQAHAGAEARRGPPGRHGRAVAGARARDTNELVASASMGLRVHAHLAVVEVGARVALVARPADGGEVAAVAHDPRVLRAPEGGAGVHRQIVAALLAEAV